VRGRLADAAAPENLAVGDEGDAGAGDVLGVENFFCGGLKFFERFGMREFVFFSWAIVGREARKERRERLRVPRFGVCAFLPRNNVDGRGV